MKIPKRDVVEFVIRSVLRSRRAESQKEFSLLVGNELRKVDPQYAITGKRLREIALSMPGVRIVPLTRKGDAPKRCPGCSSALHKVWTRNLKGKKVLEGLVCQKCGYKGSSGRWSPAKYAFSLSS
jgi:hypothetical protein